MPHAVHSNSALPSRKSRNSGEWFSRQRLRRPSAKASPNSLRVCVTPRKCSWSGAFSYAYAGEIIISSTSRSSLRKSSTSRTVFGESCVKKVVFVVTRKPAACAALIAATALSKVHRPREVRAGLELVQLALQQESVRAQVHELLAPDQLCRDRVDLGVDERLS